jgi:aspartyl-tRNA synthetase
MEKMMTEMVKKVVPEKKITSQPFPRITYQEAMAKYQTDKPDLRKNKNDPDELAFAFIVNFPLFSAQGGSASGGEYSETEKKLVPCHNPFTSPQEGQADALDKEPTKILGRQYDLVCNGFELAGGAIRIHQPEIQQKVFKILGLSEEEIKVKFGHLLEAFTYGVPPHGGIAMGLDRLIMILANEPNIREVIPYPKTADAKDLMMGAPSELPDAQLKEANIKINVKKAKS